MTTESTKNRKTIRFGVPGEDIYGYPQVVQAGDVIHVLGQLAHDMDGNLIAPGPRRCQWRCSRLLHHGGTDARDVRERCEGVGGVAVRRSTT